MTMTRSQVQRTGAGIASRLVNDYDLDHDPRTDCCGEIIRIFDYNRLDCRCCYVAYTEVPLIQGLAKRWVLGCVITASWLPLAAGGEFTQPRSHLLADTCIPVRSSALSDFHLGSAFGGEIEWRCLINLISERRGGGTDLEGFKSWIDR